MLLPECAAVIGFILIIWAAIWLMLSQEYNAAEHAAIRDTGNLARAFEENTERIVASIDQTLLSMRTSYARHPDTFDLVKWQREQTRSDPFTVQLGLIGPDGFVRGSSLGGTAAARIDVSDREHFRFHIDHPTRDDLFISKPVLGRWSGKWTVQFTRKVVNPDGSFGGVVLVSLGCEALSHFYDTLELGQGFVLLLGTDGVVRARGPLKDGAIGSGIGAGPPFLKSLTSPESHGSYRATSPLDGINRIVSFRRLPDLPLVVLVGFDTNAVFHAYNEARIRAMLVGDIATCIVLLLGTLWVLLRRRWVTSRRMLQLTFESISQGIVMVDANGEAPVVNRRALQLLDLPAEALHGSTAVAWPATPAGAPAHPSGKGPLLDLPGGVPEADTASEILRNDGKVIEVQSHPTVSGGMVLTYTDITERKLAEARILHLAHHDALTGLPNRLLLNERLEQALERVRSAGGHFAIFGLDLDGFKTVNDTMGHDAGDLVLSRFAERLHQLVRPDDTVARTGGDEFTVVVGDLTTPAMAEAVARRLLEGLVLPVDLGGYVSTLGTSIGIAVYPDDGTDSRALLKNADTALYHVKASRRGGICRFESWMDQSLAERRALERDLRQAIDRDELEVYFQPEFATSTLAVVGFEALARWRHATRGLVPPGVFIPLAEDCGLIAAIGRRVLEQACELGSRWRPRRRIAVNLSPIQFRDGNLLALLSDILRRTGFPASLLELEVTEGVLIKDEEQALGTLRALKDLGVRIALDDFGTGYASLSYLRRFPFDKIKIDRSFVNAQQQDPGTRTILEAVLAMSTRLNLSVTAEGVETRDQLVLLREQGCPEVQGFLLGRPMPDADVQEFLHTEGATREPCHLRLAASKPAEAELTAAGERAA